MPSQSTHNSYDDLPYPSQPYPFTHPDHVASVATLLGMKPAPPDRCLILELGCASGGNLIPLALALPQSNFVGIDLAREQVCQGLQTISDLGLRNIQLHPLSILDLDEGLDSFDYIICHGVYSWVPEEVQDKILEICARHLTPNGVGYISYNTYPGWHMKGMIRAMMGLHDRHFRSQPPLTRVAQARALLAFLAQAVPQGNTPYSLLLREHLEGLRESSDGYLFHEHLEECNEPVYFIGFCERLAARGLRYLGEAEFGLMVPGTSFPAEVQQQLLELAPSFLEVEQYMDLLRNRMFRQTLVCHEEVRPSYEVRAERLTGFHLASPARPKSQAPDLLSQEPEEFLGPGDMTLTATVPVVKAALCCLGEAWPRSLSFEALLDTARARLGSPVPDDPAASADRLALARALLTAYATAGKSLVELWLHPPAFVTEVSERPLASPLARWQADRQPNVTNLRHELVSLTEFDRHLLPHLDGTRDRQALVEALVERFRQGVLRITEDETPITDAARAQDILAELLDRQLPKLAKTALLVS
jgi:methyltransferase-like protein/2-polyprenyl-3-methyl-5-hydroxy-6-metoxy-1,4-benzoquinol methylase